MKKEKGKNKNKMDQNAITQNVRNWRNARGLDTQAKTKAWQEANRAAQAERIDHADTVREMNALPLSDRFAKARTLGAEVPLHAVECRFQAGKDGRGGRVHWQFTVKPVSDVVRV